MGGVWGSVGKRVGGPAIPLTLKLKSVHEKDVCSNRTVYIVISPDAG